MRPCRASSWNDVVRQQWNFSPPNTVDECEEYKVELRSAGALELRINPDVGRGGTPASLRAITVASESGRLGARSSNQFHGQILRLTSQRCTRYCGSDLRFRVTQTRS